MHTGNSKKIQRSARALRKHRIQVFEHLDLRVVKPQETPDFLDSEAALDRRLHASQLVLAAHTHQTICPAIDRVIRERNVLLADMHAFADQTDEFRRFLACPLRLGLQNPRSATATCANAPPAASMRAEGITTK
jgi:hypothetical protein